MSAKDEPSLPLTCEAGYHAAAEIPPGVNFWNSPDGAAPSRVTVLMPDGTYLVVDFVDPNVAHVASSAVLPPPAAGKKIFQSPMLDPEAAKRPAPPVNLTEEGRAVATGLGLQVKNTEAGVELYDAQGNRVASIRHVDSKQPWKGIEVDTDATHVYGLGEYPRGGGTDAPWLGSKAKTDSDHGNIMSPFYGGVNTYTQFPVAYGMRKDGTVFAVFVDTPYKIEWDFTEKGKWKVKTYGDELRYFVITGKDLAEVHQKYLGLVGKSPVPPQGVLSPGISKFGYRDWKDVDHDVAEMNKNGLPVGMVALDLYWFGGDFIHNPHGARQYTKMGTLTPDPEKFPDFEKKVAELKKKGTDVMLISESYVNLNLPEAKRLEELGCIVKDENGRPIVFENKWWGTGYMIDWTHPKSKEWIKEKYLPLAKKGIRHFWFDLGEPEAGLYAPNGRYHGVEPGKNNHGDIHNLYNLMWVKRFKEVMDAEMPNDRFYLMNRSGTSGINRLGAGKWGGDTGVSVLPNGTIPELDAHLQNRILNMPLVGVDYYTSDVGGFHRYELKGNQDHRDKAYTTWYANGALLDIPFRPHLWIKPGEDKYLPTHVGHVPSNVQNAKLRAELEPYYYRAAHRASEKGTPVIAPLVYYHGEDPAVRGMGHQAYVGPDLMMGVVTNIHEGKRNVYLPKGGWYDFNTNQYHPATANGRWVNDVQVRPEGKLTLPLFAREGAIIPMNRINAKGERTSSDKEMRVKVFAGEKKTQTEMYEDDGGTKDFQKGQIRKTPVSQAKTEKGFEVVVDPATGQFGSPRRDQRIELVSPKPVAKVLINGKEAKRVDSPDANHGNEAVFFVDPKSNQVTVLQPDRPNSEQTRYEFVLVP